MSLLALILWLLITLITWDRSCSANIPPTAPPGTIYVEKIGCNQTKTHSIRTGVTYSYEFTDEFPTPQLTPTTTFTFHTCGTTTLLDLQLAIHWIDGEVWESYLTTCDAQSVPSSTCQLCSGSGRNSVHERWTVELANDKRSWIAIHSLTSQAEKDSVSYLLTMDCTYTLPSSSSTTASPITTSTNATPITSDPTDSISPTSRPTSDPISSSATTSGIGTSIVVGSTGNPDQIGGNLQGIWVTNYVTDHMLLFIIAVICLCILCVLIVFCVCKKKRKKGSDGNTAVIHMKVSQNSPLPDKTDRNSESSNDDEDEDDKEVVIEINKTHTLDPNVKIFNGKEVEKREGERSDIEDNELPELPPMKSNDSLYDVGPRQTTTGGTRTNGTHTADGNEGSSSSDIDGMFADNTTRKETHAK
eukprot:151036_1